MATEWVKSCLTCDFGYTHHEHDTPVVYCSYVKNDRGKNLGLCEHFRWKESLEPLMNRKGTNDTHQKQIDKREDNRNGNKALTFSQNEKPDNVIFECPVCGQPVHQNQSSCDCGLNFNYKRLDAEIGIEHEATYEEDEVNNDKKSNIFSPNDRPKKALFSTFSIFHFSGDILRQTHNAKAFLYAILAIVWSTILNISPIGIGIWLLYQGEWLKAIYIPIVLYFIIGFYMAFWPFIALFSFIAGWVNYGFVDSLTGTVVFVITTFILLYGPGWLMYKAYKATKEAEKIEKSP